jgi:hypothetical protein
LPGSVTPNEQARSVFSQFIVTKAHAIFEYDRSKTRMMGTDHAARCAMPVHRAPPGRTVPRRELRRRILGSNVPWQHPVQDYTNP